MHYVSFNFGRDLGELSSTDSFHSHGHMAAVTSFENHLLFKSFHIATAWEIFFLIKVYPGNIWKIEGNF